MLLLFASFMAGVLTILAPCVLPLLPIIIGSSADASSKRSVKILIGSLALSIFVFTLLLRASTLLIDIPNSTWTTISGVILALFGLTYLFPSVWTTLSKQVSTKSKQNLQHASSQTGWKKYAIIGVSLGPVFTSCSPTYALIIAAILPVNLLTGLLYLLVYIFGLCLVLFAISVLGRKLTSKLMGIADEHGKFKKVLAIIFIVLGVGIIMGWDKDLEAKIIEQGYFGVTEFEESLIEDFQ